MTRGRAVLALLVLGVVGFGLAALPWLELTVPTVIARQEVGVSGSTAVPVIGAASLAVLAAALAVAIGGTWVRRIAGVALVILGLLVAATTVRLLIDPEPVARAAASAVSGVAQIEGDITVTPWPYLTVVLGVIVAAGGVLVLAARSWASPVRRYERGSAAGTPAPAGTAAAPTPAAEPRVQAMDDWDALGRGEDPTAPDQG
ncbi:Trp biosynthesis-associated membrane protein [Georgenia sp. MJ170]|uniref:Trp biosynthesis-associated membrane protein n=1 Tax=Georgenia sunbinii TaxID=3117728 RepID=UPI002F2674AA